MCEQHIYVVRQIISSVRHRNFLFIFVRQSIIRVRPIMRVRPAHLFVRQSIKKYCILLIFSYKSPHFDINCSATWKYSRVFQILSCKCSRILLQCFASSALQSLFSRLLRNVLCAAQFSASHSSMPRVFFPCIVPTGESRR